MQRSEERLTEIVGGLLNAFSSHGALSIVKALRRDFESIVREVMEILGPDLAEECFGDTRCIGTVVEIAITSLLSQYLDEATKLIQSLQRAKPRVASNVEGCGCNGSGRIVATRFHDLHGGS